MTPQRGAFGLILILACIGVVYGQDAGPSPEYPVQAEDPSEKLALTLEDVLLTFDKAGGYHLFIRKLPRIESVLLTAADAASYYTWGWNPVNGEERYYQYPESPGMGAMVPWFLVDSTAEPHWKFGEAFEIYIPPTLYLADGAAWKQVPVVEGMPMTIRAFTLPHADPGGIFRDSFFVLIKNIENTSGAEVIGSDLGIPSPGPKPGFHSILRISGGIAAFHPGAAGSMDELQLERKNDPGGSVSFSQGLSGIISLNLEFERDPVLMNRLMARIAADWPIFGIEAGPYFGILNPAADVISPGLSLILRAKLLSGAFSGSFRFDSSLGRDPQISGDYTQNYYEFSLGALLSRVTLGLSISDRTLIRKTSQLRDIVSIRARYNFSFDYTFRSIPLTLGLDMGYQQLTWLYMTALQPAAYHYNAAYIGPKASLKIRAVKLFFTTEAPVYPMEYLTVPNAPVLLQASLGFVWNIR
jgi:hypothetical protein